MMGCGNVPLSQKKKKGFLFIWHYLVNLHRAHEQVATQGTPEDSLKRLHLVDGDDAREVAEQEKGNGMKKRYSFECYFLLPKSRATSDLSAILAGLLLEQGLALLLLGDDEGLLPPNDVQ